METLLGSIIRKEEFLSFQSLKILADLYYKYKEFQRMKVLFIMFPRELTSVSKYREMRALASFITGDYTKALTFFTEIL